MNHKFFDRIEANRRDGMGRADAVRRAREDDPQGFDDWIVAYNREHQTTEIARERFARRTA